MRGLATHLKKSRASETVLTFDLTLRKIISRLSGSLAFGPSPLGGVS